jgi:H/ACA ribonucleoprotein complex subunit 2
VGEAAQNPIVHPTTFPKMAKEKSEKRDKKEKKEKRSDADGVKKSKKEKKSKLNGDNVAAALEEVTKVEADVEAKDLVVKEGSGEVVLKPVGALVPFANPLADEKVTKKVLKSVKKGAICCSLLPIYL